MPRFFGFRFGNRKLRRAEVNFVGPGSGAGAGAAVALTEAELHPNLSEICDETGQVIFEAGAFTASVEVDGIPITYRRPERNSDGHVDELEIKALPDEHLAAVIVYLDQMQGETGLPPFYDPDYKVGDNELAKRYAKEVRDADEAFRRLSGCKP